MDARKRVAEGMTVYTRDGLFVEKGFKDDDHV